MKEYSCRLLIRSFEALPPTGYGRVTQLVGLDKGKGGNNLERQINPSLHFLQLVSSTCEKFYLNILYSNGPFGFGMNHLDNQLGSRLPCVAPRVCLYKNDVKSCLLRAKIPPVAKAAGLDFLRNSDNSQVGKIKGVPAESPDELSDEDDDLCPVDCVKEFKTDEEFLRIIEKAKETDSLVVVDFYRPSCGSCKYIEQGFSKLCKRSGDQDAPVIFLKHNVIDEYDEQSEVAERLRIKTVPLFHFYKNGVLLEAFPTRDKERITSAILRYASCNHEEI